MPKTYPGFFTYKRGQYRPRRKGMVTPFRKVGRVKKSYTNKKVFQPTSGAEWKFRDGAQEASAISATGAMASTNLFQISQGVGDIQRIGRKIMLKKWNIRYAYGIEAKNNGLNDILRVIIGIDHQCNGAVPAVLDILETATYRSFRNLANKGRFTILSDKFHPVEHPAGGPASTTTTLFAESEGYVQLNLPMNLPIEFDGVVGTIVDLTSNNVFILLISKNASAFIDLQWRFRYTDV